MVWLAPHGHHVTAAGDQSVHNYHHGLLLPQLLGLHIKAFAGGGSTAGTLQLDYHRLDGVIAAGIVEVFADYVSRLLRDNREGNVYDAYLGSPRKDVEKYQDARRYAQSGQGGRNKVPAGENFQDGEHEAVTRGDNSVRWDAEGAVCWNPATYLG